MTAQPDAIGAEKFDLELYRILKSESASYFEKLQSLWLQKFILVGAVIAFLVTNHDKLALEAEGVVVPAAILAIPVLAALLDAKILEFTLHARAISRFIGSHFEAQPTLVKWESLLWGVEGAPQDLRIVRLRSLTTTLITIVPTIVVWLLASIVLGQMTGMPTLGVSLGVGVCGLYVLITWLSWGLIWPRTVSP